MGNAIAYAQFTLRGGWRNLLITTAVYAMVVVSAITFTAAIEPRSQDRILGNWISILLGIQSAMLVLFGGSRINLAVQNDTKFKMFESHRLMPMSAGQAIFGYLIGAPCQAMMLAAANVIIGVGLCLKVGIVAQDFLFANLIIVLFAMFLWTITVMFAFVWKAAAGLTLVGMMFSYPAVFILPGLLLIATPLHGGMIFDLKAGGGQISQNQFVAFLFQAMLGTMCFVAAMRKYRWGDEVPAFGPWLGLSVLIIVVASTILGVWYWDDLAPMRMRGEADDMSVQFIASISAVMILAAVPIAGASFLEAQRRRAIAAGAVVRRRLFISVEFIAIGAAAIAMVLLMMHPIPLRDALRMSPEQKHTLAAAVTGASVTLFLLTLSFVFQIMHRVTTRLLLMTVVTTVVLWLGPMMVDYAIAVSQEREHLSSISAASPLGALILAWSRTGIDSPNFLGGIIFQSLVTAVIGALFSLRASPRGELPISTKRMSTDAAAATLPGQRTPPADSSARFEFMDVARLLAAFAIVWVHVPESPAAGPTNALGDFAVPFFLISAVVLLFESERERGSRTYIEYAKSRFVRLYLPMLLWSLIYLASRNAKQIGLYGIIVPPNPKMLLAGAAAHTWFLTFLLAVSLLIQPIARAVTKWSPRGRRVFAAAAAVLGVGTIAFAEWVGVLPSHDDPLLFWLDRAFHFSGTVIVAVAIGAIFPELIGTLRSRLLTWAALTVAVILSAVMAFVFGRHVAGLDVAAGLGFFVFALASFQPSERWRNWGRLAFGFYLAHVLFIEGFQAAAIVLKVPKSVGLDISVFVLTILCTLLLVIGLSKTRLGKWLVP